MTYSQAILGGWITGIVLGLALAAAVVISGATFWQRCEAMGFVKWSPEWEGCVARLSGKAIRSVGIGDQQ